MTPEDHIKAYLTEHGGEARMRVMMTDLSLGRKCAWPNSFNAVHRMERDGTVELSSVVVRQPVTYTNRTASYQTNKVTVVRLTCPKKEKSE